MSIRNQAVPMALTSVTNRFLRSAIRCAAPENVNAIKRPSKAMTEASMAADPAVPLSCLLLRKPNSRPHRMAASKRKKKTTAEPASTNE
ncbi:hypothetical protein G6F40_014620 [Rhizopus arrhizus]|nr:hypothetical protein G6F40_014620 [Rhizopus arrhizus]